MMYAIFSLQRSGHDAASRRRAGAFATFDVLSSLSLPSVLCVLFVGFFAAGCDRSEAVTGAPIALMNDASPVDGGTADMAGTSVDTGTSAIDTAKPAKPAKPDGGWSKPDTTQSPDVAEPVPPFVASTVAPNHFIVHEWGTFTSVQGSDGVSLDGLHHEEEHLPSFVYGRSMTSGQGKAMEHLPEPCNQKMETPVVYFHTDAPVDVALKVDFPKGVISQWFPGAASFLPKLSTFKSPPYDGPPTQHLAGGSMTWHVNVDPARTMAKAPKVPADSIWLPARNTNAAVVRYHAAPAHKYAKVTDETERFLFYRGLGRFTLPMRVTGQGKGWMTLHNDSSDVVPYVVVLHTTESGTGGVGIYTPIGSKSAMNMRIPAINLSKTEAIQAAKNALKKGIIHAGLYKDEAQGMVDTWQRSWFATPGVRVLYVLPQSWTEKLLPMTVQPTPQSLVRVLIGRIEVLTPENEAAVMAQVTKKKPGTPGFQPYVSGIGRFREPRIRRACKLLNATHTQLCKGLINAASKSSY